MWRFMQKLGTGTKSKKSVANLRSDPLCRITIRLIREEIYRILKVPLLKEVLPCNICKGKPTPGHKCALKAILSWMVTENVSSDACMRRCQKAIKRISMKRMVGRKTIVFKRIRRDIQNNKMRAAVKKPISRKVKCRPSTRRTMKQRLGLKRSIGKIRKVRSDRITSSKKQAIIKRSKTTKPRGRQDENPSRRYVKKCLVYPRYTSTKPIRRGSLSNKSQVRAGHRLRASKRSRNLGSSKLQRNKKVTAKGYQSRKNKRCPPRH